MSAPRVTVVVPSYSGAATLEGCLRSIAASVAAAGVPGTEVVVVDSSPEEAPARIAASVPGVRVVRSARRLSAGAARNLGVRESRGELVAFVDQDCRVPVDWIGRVTARLAAGDVDGIGGSYAIADPENLAGTVLYFLEFLYHLPGPAREVASKRFLVCGNSAWRRPLLEAVLFPDRTMGEDVAFCAHVRAAGFRFVYDPSLAIQHVNKRGVLRVGAYAHALGRASAQIHRDLGAGPGRAFLAFPPLALLAPLGVVPYIVLRAAATRRAAYAVAALALSPAILAGSLAWSLGFTREALGGSR